MTNVFNVENGLLETGVHVYSKQNRNDKSNKSRRVVPVDHLKAAKSNCF